MNAIPDLIGDVARRYGERPALGIRRGLRTERWSYLDVERGMRRAADNLAVRGVGPGDRVMVLAPNSPELVLSMLGAWAAGAILVPIDLRTPPEDRKSTRLNSSHLVISYAVFCLKKKKETLALRSLL